MSKFDVFANYTETTANTTLTNTTETLISSADVVDLYCITATDGCSFSVREAATGCVYVLSLKNPLVALNGTSGIYATKSANPSSGTITRVERTRSTQLVDSNNNNFSSLLQTIAPIVIPTGFRLTSIPYNLRRRGNSFLTDFDIRTLIPPTTKEYFVDPNGGNDANSGLTRLLALQKVSTALAKVDVDKVTIINLTTDFVAKGSFGFNNVVPARSVSVINENAPTARFVTTPFGTSATTPVYTVNPTFSNLYKTPSIAANTQSVMDFKTKTQRSKTGLNVPKVYDTYAKAADLATCAATPGSYFNDGTDTHINPRDGRNLIGDQLMFPLNGSNNGRSPGTTGLSIYCRGIDFCGGRPWYSSVASVITGVVCAFEDCSFQGGGTGINGLNIAAFQTLHLYRCTAAGNNADGFNLHSNEQDGTTPATSPTTYFNECFASDNGIYGSAGVSDNGFTGHDFCNTVCFNCESANAADRNVVFIGNSHLWWMGGAIGTPLTGIAESFAMLETSFAWIDSTTITGTSTNPPIVAAQTATISNYNCTVMRDGVSAPFANGVTAEATGTIKSYYG